MEMAIKGRRYWNMQQKMVYLEKEMKRVVIKIVVIKIPDSVFLTECMD